MQILVVERTQEISVQDQEIQRRERELEATVRRPAEAEKYRLDWDYSDQQETFSIIDNGNDIGDKT